MERYQPITPSKMRNINRTAVLEYIRQNETASRAEISKELGISLPSVVRIIDELFEEDILRYKGEYEASGGRRRPLIEISTDENLVLGLDLGGTKAYACVSDLGGNILYEKNINVHKTEGNESYEMVVSLISDMYEHAKTLNKNIRGISIGVPAVTDHKSGEVIFAPSLKWENFPLKEKLEQEFDLPIIVENDVNMAALGELWYGHGKKSLNLVLIAIGTGLGAGIIVDGCIYRGANKGAGELGYMVLDESELDQAYPGFGPLELKVAGYGLGEQAKKALKEIRGDNVDDVTAEHIFEAYGKNEMWATEIVENVINKLSMMIISTCAVMDPEMIILSGGVMNSSKHILKEIQEKVNTVLPEKVNIHVSDLRQKATILGGIVTIMYQSTNYSIIRTMY